MNYAGGAPCHTCLHHPIRYGTTDDADTPSLPACLLVVCVCSVQHVLSLLSTRLGGGGTQHSLFLLDARAAGLCAEAFFGCTVSHCCCCCCSSSRHTLPV